jgi:3-methylfumaryl-CoA hydratase
VSDLTSWIGRTQLLYDLVTLAPIERLSAVLDREEPSLQSYDPLPPLAHWLLFLPTEPQSRLDSDGYARRGGFMPRHESLGRQMWGGARIGFHAPIRIGMEIERRSEIVSVTAKQGEAGELLVVVIRHDIAVRGGGPLLTEHQDILFRSASPASGRRPARAELKHADWERTVIPDPILLFRYSALTFNSHRIHYDRAYTTGIEGYPGLVVHGPLVATLLGDLLRRNYDTAPKSLIVRASAPCFDGAPLRLQGARRPDSDHADLWAINSEGDVAMRIEAAY